MYFCFIKFRYLLWIQNAQVLPPSTLPLVMIFYAEAYEIELGWEILVHHVLAIRLPSITLAAWLKWRALRFVIHCLWSTTLWSTSASIVLQFGYSHMIWWVFPWSRYEAVFSGFIFFNTLWAICSFLCLQRNSDLCICIIIYTNQNWFSSSSIWIRQITKPSESKI